LGSQNQLKMSKKGYSDAEKAAYWKKKATGGGASRAPARSYNNKGSKYNPKYVAEKRYMRQEDWDRRRQRNTDAQDPGVISSIGNTLGGMAGGFFGGPAGALAGNFLGGKLGHLVEKITGFGDYKVRGNSIMKGGTSPPQIVNSMNRGSVIVRHREFIADIKATTAFTVKSYPINPGLSGTFPWLSQIAGSFEQYRMRGCLFEFLSTSSDALLSSSTSTALGTVNMATQYDVAHANFVDKRGMLNHEFANSSKPSVTFIHPVECKRNRTPITELYTRFGTPPNGSDPHLYDLGNFQIATEGMQAAGGVLGELWVTYEVELFKQQFFIESFSDHWFLTAPVAGAWLGISASHHLLREGSTIGGTINDAGDTYSFPPDISAGKFLCTYYCQGTSVSVGATSISVNNGVLLDDWLDVDSTLYVQSPASGVASITLMSQIVVSITAPSCTLQFGAANVPTSGKGDFWVTRIADSILT